MAGAATTLLPGSLSYLHSDIPRDDDRRVPHARRQPRRRPGARARIELVVLPWSRDGVFCTASPARGAFVSKLRGDEAALYGRHHGRLCARGAGASGPTPH